MWARRVVWTSSAAGSAAKRTLRELSLPKQESSQPSVPASVLVEVHLLIPAPGAGCVAVVKPEWDPHQDEPRRAVPMSAHSGHGLRLCADPRTEPMGLLC